MYYHHLNYGLTSSVAGTVFVSNRGGINGGAIHCDKSQVKFSMVISGGQFISNSAVNGGFAYLSGCHISMHQTISIVSNVATNGGAVYAEYSEITFFRYLPVRADTVALLANNTAEKTVIFSL